MIRSFSVYSNMGLRLLGSTVLLSSDNKEYKAILFALIACRLVTENVFPIIVI